MEIYFLLILLGIIYIIAEIFYIDEDTEIKIRDAEYFEKFSQKKIISRLLNNNLIKNPVLKNNKILIITYDNRNNEKYIKMHNHNIKKYCDKWGYEYKFYNYCNDNVYWCKIYMVLNALKSGEWDYVMWMDSDTIIKDFDINLGFILNNFSSDIFIGSDNNKLYDLTNAGVFIIKNSEVGKQFLLDCGNYVSYKCLKEDGTLKGEWAASCYEQGVMNLLIAEKYSNYTTLLSNDIIFNFNRCSDNVFIMHLYASSSNNRVKCFNSKNPALTTK
jgi:hypothetical protein